LIGQVLALYSTGKTLCRRIVVTVGLLLLVSASLAQDEIPKDPLFIRIQDGWLGLFPHEDEYARYALKGSDVKLEDPYHAHLNQHLGVMVTFANKTEFGDKPDLLTAHRQWELAYWREQAAKVESNARDDLSGGRTDLKITEIRLYNNQGSQLRMYCVALASKEGVFVLSVSGPNESIPGSIDSLVKEMADSYRLVRRPLDAAELKRVVSELKAKP